MTAFPGHSIALRRAGPDDAPAIGEFQTRCWRHTYAGLVPADYLERNDATLREVRWRERLVSGERSVALAEQAAREERAGDALTPESGDGRTLIGVVSWHSSEADGAPALELKSLYVDAAHHGSGVAQSLTELALGAAPARLWVFEANGRARAFYAKQGFVPDGTHAIDKDTGVPEIRMVRRGSLALERGPHGRT